MKKAIAAILSIVMVIMIFPCTLAQEEPAPLTTLEIVAQLQENPLVKEIWVPILPEGYQIEQLVVSPNGSYYFQIECINTDLTNLFSISVINNTPIVGGNDHISPYQVYCLNNGIADFSVTPELAEQVASQEVYRFQYNNHYSRTLIYGSHRMGQYKGLSAVDTYWSIQSQSYADIMIGGRVYETLFNLSPNATATINRDLFPQEIREQLTEDNYFEMLENHIGVTFTTFGDTDGNMKVNALDALAILKHAVQKASITDELALFFADTNGDEIINATDALRVLHIAVGKAV